MNLDVMCGPSLFLFPPPNLFFISLKYFIYFCPLISYASNLRSGLKIHYNQKMGSRNNYNTKYNDSYYKKWTNYRNNVSVIAQNSNAPLPQPVIIEHPKSKQPICRLASHPKPSKYHGVLGLMLYCRLSV